MPTQPETVVHVLGSLAVGGGEHVALNLVRGQVERGLGVHVVSLTNDPDAPLASPFRTAGAKLHHVPRLGPTFDPSLVLRMAAAFRAARAELVHTHNPLPLIYGGPASRLVGLPLVHTKHGFNAASARRQWLRRVAGRFAHAVVAVSEQTAADAVEQKDCAPERLAVIENGIELHAFAPDDALKRRMRTSLGVPHDAFVIGTVGRMTAVKNQALLVRAAAPLLSDKTRLLLVGDGPERPTVESSIRQAGVGAETHLLGARSDVAQLLPAFDVFALPSKSEGLPMVLPEAMASGLPVVATRVGGVPSVVEHGVTGFLTQPEDAENLREHLSRLVQDPALGRRMGQTARRIALERYSAKRMVEQYLELYSRVLRLASERGALSAPPPDRS